MNNDEFSKLLSERSATIDDFLVTHMRQMPIYQHRSTEELRTSMNYSLMSGGKRFRSVLALLVGEMLEVKNGAVVPFASAVEMIHTYSLIHDDLPCMDDDDVRRGQPSNHKKFGEPMALLAGDALLTEAFNVVATYYSDTPAVAASLVQLLAQAAGTCGMVGGQALDIRAQKEQFSFTDLEEMHRRKTGDLIQVAVSGAAKIGGLSMENWDRVITFGEFLGLSFQIADDILDFEPNNPELGSYPHILGMEKTRTHLTRNTKDAIQMLQPWGDRAANLVSIARYNQNRTGVGSQ